VNEFELLDRQTIEKVISEMIEKTNCKTDGCVKMLSDLNGREFDWFAVDSDGNIAMFATAGEGFVPDSVMLHVALYDELSECLPAQAGSLQVWDDYAAFGFYVFDWSLPGGPYILERTPSTSMATELRQRILEISGLPIYPGLFSELGKLSAWAVT
jgi:hypothetical protein